MNKWVNQFLEPDKLTDNTDIFTSNSNLSVLSVPHQGYLDQNLENRAPSCTDSTDIFTVNSNLSVLSVPHQGYLDQNLENMAPSCIDSTDIFNSTSNLSVLSVPYLLDEYEERLAIAEYDGIQSSSQAERIAYLDAFMAVLANLPYEDSAEDWLPQRIRNAQNWLLYQGIEPPK